MEELAGRHAWAHTEPAGAQTRGFARPVVSVPPDLEPNVVKLVDHQDAGAPLLDYIRVAQAVAVGRDV